MCRIFSFAYGMMITESKDSYQNKLMIKGCWKDPNRTIKNKLRR